MSETKAQPMRYDDGCVAFHDGCELARQHVRCTPATCYANCDAESGCTPSARCSGDGCGGHSQGCTHVRDGRRACSCGAGCSAVAAAPDAPVEVDWRLWDTREMGWRLWAERMAHYGYTPEQVETLRTPADHRAFGCEPVESAYGWDCTDQDDCSLHPEHDEAERTHEWIDWLLAQSGLASWIKARAEFARSSNAALAPASSTDDEATP